MKTFRLRIEETFYMTSAVDIEAETAEEATGKLNAVIESQKIDREDTSETWSELTSDGITATGDVEEVE